MTTHGNVISVFLSYAHEDEPLLRQLETHLSLLKRQGLISTWYDRQIVPGTNWAKVIDERLEEASIILLLVSSDFLTSDYCYQVEMKRALERHEADQARVIPIALRPADWKDAPFAHLQALPTGAKAITTWRNRDRGFLDVAAGIRRAIEDLSLLPASLSRAALPAIWNIPYPRNPFFLGRDDILSRLHTQLRAGQVAPPQAISGLGGIGKTQIAVEYVYRYSQEYKAVLWAHAESKDTLISSYNTIATLLKLPEREAQEQDIILQAVKMWLQTSGRWLLVLDNADEIAMVKEFIPPAFQGHLLLTTRAQVMGALAHKIEVETMMPETGALLLLRRAGLIAPDAPLEQASPTDVMVAKELSEEMGGLPLALDQAGAYIESVSCTPQDYQQLYQVHRDELLKERGGIVSDYPDSVATTWSLAFQKVEQGNPAASDLLRLCAFLHPDAIPEEMIIKGAEHLGTQLKATASDPLALNKAIMALRAYSLLHRDSATHTLTIHRLVQAVLRNSIPEEQQRHWVERAVRALNQVFPFGEVAPWPSSQRYLPQALVCEELIRQWHITLDEASNLLHNTGTYLRERGQYREAEPLYGFALAIREERYGHDHPDTRFLLNNLAILYGAQGKYEQAEPLYQRALAISEKTLGAEHPSTASTLNNLALLYSYLYRYEQAEPLYQRALTIKEKTLGAEHPSTASTLNNLALLYTAQCWYWFDQGKCEQAEPLYQRALAISEKTLGAEHPDTASTLNNLASFYRDQHKYEQAELLYQRALSIKEKALGAEHPSTAGTLYNLALLYSYQGQYERAEPLLQRALSIRERMLGAEHPDTVTSFDSLAILYSNQGQNELAHLLFMQGAGPQPAGLPNLEYYDQGKYE